MKTEQEIKTRILALEEENKLLQAKDNTIIQQTEIHKDEMDKLLADENKVKSNQALMEVLKWVLE